MVDQGGSGGSAVLVQFIPLIVFNLLLVIPFVRILRRAGRSGWWVLLLLLPGIGWLVLPWVVAFMRWERPKEELGRVFG